MKNSNKKQEDKVDLARRTLAYYHMYHILLAKLENLLEKEKAVD